MYTTKNYKSKKALKEDLAKGVRVTYFPHGLGKVPQNGRITLEGPHYPEPHRWYAEAEVKNGIIVSVK